MEPNIPEGSYCIFRAYPAGSRNNKILLVRYREIADPDTGGSFTIKKYNSEKVYKEDRTWSHSKIVLSPTNSDYEPIVFENVDEDFESEFKVIGEFIQLYEPE